MGRRPGRRPTPEPDPGPDRATIPHCPRDARPCRWSAGSPLAQLAVVGRPPGAATSHCQQLGPEDAEDRLAATSTPAAAGRAVASSFEVVTYRLPLAHPGHTLLPVSLWHVRLFGVAVQPGTTSAAGAVADASRGGLLLIRAGSLLVARGRW